jgi:hypothetical protein
VKLITHDQRIRSTLGRDDRDRIAEHHTAHGVRLVLCTEDGIRVGRAFYLEPALTHFQFQISGIGTRRECAHFRLGVLVTSLSKSGGNSISLNDASPSSENLSSSSSLPAISS